MFVIEMKNKIASLLFICACLHACAPSSENNMPSTETIGALPKDLKSQPFHWNNANVYFLLLDRFNNASPENDIAYERTKDVKDLRRFMGGDIKGIIQKIEDGYFDKLGISAIWFTPPVEQIHGATDEGAGETYGYHGYWAKDWTAIDESYGTEADLGELVKVAHNHGIRILMDVVVNHTGPATEEDPAWPDEWVRQDPQCTYEDAASTISCTLVANLPDIRTESNEEVALPPQLVEKWKKEGRYEQEMAELDAFFERTGHPRAPRFYIIKWLTDYVRKHGIDGFRVDTVKHTEAYVWGELYKEALAALKEWKQANPSLKLDDEAFYMTGEVYGYSIHQGLNFQMGEKDEPINYYKEGFGSLINFSFAGDMTKTTDELFSMYSQKLNQGPLSEYSVLNYLSSHDDSNPFDAKRTKPFEAGTKLLLSPGASQVYYGDETARLLVVDGAEGDTNLRSFMNWDELTNGTERAEGYTPSQVLAHWRKLGRFRREHLSVGAGEHQVISKKPYLFARTLTEGNGQVDAVVVGLELVAASTQTIDVSKVFEDGTQLKDYYSNKLATVKDGKVTIETPATMVLLGKPLP